VLQAPFRSGRIVYITEEDQRSLTCPLNFGLYPTKRLLWAELKEGSPLVKKPIPKWESAE
jgi:hypothetical protein